MDFNARVTSIIEETLWEGGSLTTLHINSQEVRFQIQPVAHLDHVQRDTKARFYPISHHCLSVVFWHPAPDTDRMVPIACFPCLASDGLFPTADNIRFMTRAAVLSIDTEYGERQALLAAKKG